MSAADTVNLTDVGPVTACLIDVPEGRIEVEGADDAAASVDIRYLDRAESAGGDPVADGVVEVAHVDGALSIRSRDVSRRGPAILLRGIRRPRVAVRVRMPRSATLEIQAVGASVGTVGCRGGQVVSTVTGDVRCISADDGVAVRTVSGSVEVTGESVRVDASTTSARVRVDAVRMTSLQVRTVSGRVEVVGRLSSGHEHQLQSLSGDVNVDVVGGATLIARTVSGHLVAGPGVRTDQRQGGSALVAGTGDALVHVTTVSGDVSLRQAAAPQGARPSTTADAMLEALEALARGEISVEEADRRLAVLHG